MVKLGVTKLKVKKPAKIAIREKKQYNSVIEVKKPKKAAIKAKKHIFLLSSVFWLMPTFLLLLLTW